MAVQQSYDNTNDYDLTNLFYLQNVPSVASQQQEALTANVQAIDSWLAWELTKVETAVSSKLKGGLLKPAELPSDSSIASKLKRIGYRIKVVNAYRQQTPWLTTTGAVNQTTTVTAAENDINLVVLHAVLGLQNFPGGSQVVNVVKAISSGVLDTPDLAQDHAIHVIDHQLDPVKEVLIAVVKTFAFNITMKEVPNPTPRAKGAQSGTYYQATIAYSVSSATFDFNQWNSNKPSDDASYAAGRNALIERELKLLA